MFLIYYQHGLNKAILFVFYLKALFKMLKKCNFEPCFEYLKYILL